MAVVDSAPEGGKFRGIAVSGLDGTAGAWGDGSLLCVTIDTDGYIALAGAADVDGVILTTEGKRDSTAATYKKVEGGKKYTVFQRAIFVEVDQWAGPTVVPGDRLYAAASGDVTTTPSADANYIGVCVLGDGGGSVFVLDVHPPAEISV